MTPEQFTYWLQGKLEGRKIIDLEGNELKSIQDHLNTVFHKVTPTHTPLGPQGPWVTPPSWPGNVTIC
jgi:hypothetical protein